MCTGETVPGEGEGKEEEAASVSHAGGLGGGGHGATDINHRHSVLLWAQQMPACSSSSSSAATKLLHTVRTVHVAGGRDAFVAGVYRIIHLRPPLFRLLLPRPIKHSSSFKIKIK